MAIHQEVDIKGAPQAVYEILTDAEKFSAMTGGRSAEITAEEGGAVALFGGDIQARNVELVPGKRVVQAWRSGAWPEGVYSIVRFELEGAAGGTGEPATSSRPTHPVDDAGEADEADEATLGVPTPATVAAARVGRGPRQLLSAGPAGPPGRSDHADASAPRCGSSGRPSGAQPARM